RPGHAPLRADEACGASRPAHGSAAFRGGAAEARELNGRQLQPGRVSEPSEVRRTKARAPFDSRARTSRSDPLRPDSSEHVYLRAGRAHRDPTNALTAARSLR